ncbi:MAG: hypothetical protein ABSF95_10130 [Verrucomicrobiota bacterium]
MKTCQTGQTTNKAQSQSDWVKTPIANLVCYKPSRIYFARLCIRGKLFRQTLKSDGTGVASQLPHQVIHAQLIKHHPKPVRV